MCTMVLVIKPNGRELCETVGELARALGVRQNKVSSQPFDACLCSVDLEAHGARLATESEGFPFPEYVIEVLA